MQEISDRDFYSDNLVTINKDNKAVARENIYNAAGALLLPAGAEIHSDNAQKIVQHKLQKPLEESVSLDKLLTKPILIEQLKAMPTHPEMVDIFDNKLSIDRFSQQCDQLKKHPLIIQKLTVFSMRYPEQYKKTLFGVYLGLLICEERNLDEKTWNNVFIAALCRDIGLVHIDPKVVDKKAALTGAEWKLLQGHVAIGYQFLSHLPNVSKNIATAVLEHHERTDGFGYPRHLSEDKLGVEGQILAFSDMFIALFYKYVFGHGFSLIDLAAIVQINAGIHKQENTEAAMRLMRALAENKTRKPVFKDLREQLERILACQPKAYEWIRLADLLNKQLFQIEKSPKLKQNIQMMTRVKSVMRTSGVFDQTLLDWIKSLDPIRLTSSDIAEIEHFTMMLNESIWQLGTLQKSFSVIVQQLQKKGVDLKDAGPTKIVLDALHEELAKGLLVEEQLTKSKAS